MNRNKNNSCKSFNFLYCDNSTFVAYVFKSPVELPLFPFYFKAANFDLKDSIFAFNIFRKKCEKK